MSHVSSVKGSVSVKKDVASALNIKFWDIQEPNLSLITHLTLEVDTLCILRDLCFSNWEFLADLALCMSYNYSEFWHQTLLAVWINFLCEKAIIPFELDYNATVSRWEKVRFLFPIFASRLKRHGKLVVRVHLWDIFYILNVARPWKHFSMTLVA